MFLASIISEEESAIVSILVPLFLYLFSLWLISKFSLFFIIQLFESGMLFFVFPAWGSLRFLSPIWKIFKHYSFMFFFLLHSLSLFGTTITFVLVLLVLPHRLWSHIFKSFFFLCSSDWVISVDLSSSLLSCLSSPICC